MEPGSYLNISIAACLLVAILTLVITYVVHKDELHGSFKGGYWFGLICVCLAIIGLVIKISTQCECADNY